MGTPKNVQPLSLKEWIEKEGMDTIAKALRVNVSGVRHWKRGLVLPRDDQKLKIIKLSRGAVSADEMLERHFSKENTNRWIRR